jgi:uncharacterized protein (DUF983 family)
VEQAAAPIDQSPALSGKPSQAMQKLEITSEKVVAHPVSGWVAAINRPWLLLTIPCIVGGIWLANNSWVITNNLDKPYALAAGPALVASIVLGWLIINFFKSIAGWCSSAGRAFQKQRSEDGSAQFFWIVIIVFMIVSVFASGTFFNTLEHNALPGLGYVTALFIDLVAVQAMRARLNAVRMRDKKGASLYLFGVLLCAGASAFANVYTSLADFNQHLSGALPLWMLIMAPWFGLVFPALILLLSMTADYTIDQISTQLDPEQYKAHETKRIKLLEYQRDALRERVVLESEIDRYTLLLQNKKERRTFFLVDWLFPLRHLAPVQPELDTQKITDDVVNTLRPWFQFIDTKYEQAGLVMQTAHNNSVQGLRKTIMEVDADIRLLMRDTQNIHTTLNTLTNLQNAKIAEQKNLYQREEKNTSALKRSEKRGKTQNLSELSSSKISNVSEQIARKFSNVSLNALQLTPTEESVPESVESAPVEEQQPIQEDQAVQEEQKAAEASIPSAFPIEISSAAEVPDAQNTGALHVPDGILLDVIAQMRDGSSKLQAKQPFFFDTSEMDAVSLHNFDVFAGDSEPAAQDTKDTSDADEVAPQSAEKSLAHGPYSMSIEEVAEKFDTTTKIIEAAVANGQLTLAKRGQNKILISSLQSYSPPRRRRRRSTTRLETQPQEVSIF